MNEPATREDVQQAADAIRADMRSIGEKIANAIISFGERMDRRFDAMDQRFDSLDRRTDYFEINIGRLEDNARRFASKFSGFDYLAKQSDRSAQILAIQAAQQRHAAKHLGQPPQ